MRLTGEFKSKQPENVDTVMIYTEKWKITEHRSKQSSQQVQEGFCCVYKIQFYVPFTQAQAPTNAHEIGISMSIEYIKGVP